MEKNELVYETFIRTTPEKLWAAVTTPETTRRYWAGGENVSDWKKGSQWKHVTNGGNPTVRVTGSVLEAAPPKRLVLSWADPADAADTSRVTFEIEKVEDAVYLKVTHGGFKNGSPMPGRVAWGWPRVLSSMKTFLETGEALNIWAAH
jgi:uncharacterized protein YndB with AHSA1/START domain